jgi:drug/metabolite transporter (DMT)-like permease
MVAFSTSSGHSVNPRGILLMVLAMAGFAVEDAMIKAASVTVPVGQIMLLIAGAGFVVFALWAVISGQPLFQRLVISGPLVGRTLSEMVGSGGILMGLALAPLSLVSAILQASPIMVVAAAAVFLGEKVGWRRWIAILVGFCGVLVIIRPGSADFDPNVLWAVVGVIGMSARDIFSRRMDRALHTTVVATWGYVGVILLSIGMMAVSGGPVRPDSLAWTQILIAMVIGFGAYWAIIEATRAGDVSVITPFRYTRLIFALVLGFAMFSERPDMWTIFGAILVIGSGLYTLYRERLRTVEARSTAIAIIPATEEHP